MQIYAGDFSEQSDRPITQPLLSLGLCAHAGTERELQIPEGESRADDTAAATCLGMENFSWEPLGSAIAVSKGGLDEGGSEGSQPLCRGGR